MSLSKVTRNCQITIPAKVRKALGIHEGDYVDVEEEEGRIVIKKLERERKTIRLGKELEVEEVEREIEKGAEECMQ